MSDSIFHIDPEILDSIHDFDWAIRSLAMGEYVGKKRSKKLGTGMEFSQYRPYSQGDDLRQLDWKMYARTDRFYIKQSEVETNVDVTFIIDNSRSMLYKEVGISKLHFAKVLTGVLGYVAMENGDLIGIADGHSMTSGNDTRHWNRFLNKLQGLEESKYFENPYIENRRSKELFVFISDLYEEDQEIRDFVKTLKSPRNEVIVFHVMGELEESLDFGNAVKLKDLETDKEVQFSPRSAKLSYQDQLTVWKDQLAIDFVEKGIDLQEIYFNTPVGQVINTFLNRRKQLL